MASLGDNWRGSVVCRSSDGGENGENTFSAVIGMDSEATIGIVLNDIRKGPRNSFDNANAITVALINGTLSGVNELAFLNGANVCVCGDEIIQLQNATLVSANKYTLSKLLRGRLGTEHEISNHTPGERFIFLDSAVVKEEIVLPLIGLQRHYKT